MKTTAKLKTVETDAASKDPPKKSGVVVPLRSRLLDDPAGNGSYSIRRHFPYDVRIISWTSAFKREQVRGWVVATYTDDHGIDIRTSRCWLAVAEDGMWECPDARISMPVDMAEDFATKVAGAIAEKYGAQAIADTPPPPIEDPKVGMPAEFDHREDGPLYGEIVEVWTQHYEAVTEKHVLDGGMIATIQRMPEATITWVKIKVDVKSGMLPERAKRIFKVNARRVRPSAHWGAAVAGQG